MHVVVNEIVFTIIFFYNMLVAYAVSHSIYVI